MAVGQVVPTILSLLSVSCVLLSHQYDSDNPTLLQFETPHMIIAFCTEDLHKHAFLRVLVLHFSTTLGTLCHSP